MSLESAKHAMLICHGYIFICLTLSPAVQVEDVYFPKERASGRRRPFCFVTFASQKVLIFAVMPHTKLTTVFSTRRHWTIPLVCERLFCFILL